MPITKKQLDNLIPAKKGDIRNPKGKPKGTKHISTWIQELLNDEEFTIDNFLFNGKQFKGAPVKAIITVAISNALQGDQKWGEWLAKHGYGNKLIIETSDPAEAALKKLGLIDAGEAEGSKD